MMLIPLFLLLSFADAAPLALAPGDHTRTLEVDGWTRTYVIHVPAKYDPAQPTPVVLAFHGAGMNAQRMRGFTGLSRKADEAGFLLVYPNGTGPGPLQTFSCGGVSTVVALFQPDDVSFTAKLLDDLATVVHVDSKRVYATGMSNGGMMCYRLAAHLSDRIAAIAPVAGTMAVNHPQPSRPVPVLHFHGTADRLVPYTGPDPQTSGVLAFKSVDDTIAAWVKINGCREPPTVETLPDKAADGLRVTRKTYSSPTGADVILVVIDGGGHTWPGHQPVYGMLGKSTLDISANDMLWEFFQQHRLP